MQTIRIEPVQMDIYQSITYVNDFRLTIVRRSAKDSRESANVGPTDLYTHFFSLSKYSPDQIPNIPCKTRRYI